MKTFIFISFITLIAFLCDMPSLSAQVQSTDMVPAEAAQQIDEKLQKQIDKATMDLAKDQTKLIKSAEKLEKDQAKFKMLEAKGKLSPLDVTKTKKKLLKDAENIEKLKASIAKNEAFLKVYNL